jgi:hypothetical protein
MPEFMNGEKVVAEYDEVTLEIDGDSFVTEVRVIEYEDGTRVLEYAMTCENCGSKNWILVGTDPGEYRCNNCTGWL